MSDGNEAESGRANDYWVCRRRVVWWAGQRCRVLRRRAVDGFAMIQTSSHELFLAALDGGIDPEWVPENEVELRGENEIEDEPTR